ncbi:MAG: PilZ domain-containing protein [Gammaproteobacteria bacterium]|nr:PilZ domain-containing protein [Pseudomonadales bacterium]MCP5345979.1 PilZ domain-containing protein [Pseudomonadales bacterium]
MESRSEDRIESKLNISVHVHLCEDKPELVGTTFHCEACDISPHGMRFISELGLPPGTLVNVTIGVETPDTNFLLFSEVCWEFESDGKLMKGVRFLEAEHTDLRRWLYSFDTIVSRAA